MINKRPKPRIVLDARTIRSSSGRYVDGLLRHLPQAGPDYDYIALVRPGDESLVKPAANLTAMTAPFADFSWREQIGLRRLLDRLRPDLVHFCFPQHPLLYRGRFVVTIHDLTMLDFGPGGLTGRLKKSVFAQIIRRAGQRADLIITDTEYVKQVIGQRFKFDPAKIVAVPLAAAPLATDPQPIAQLENRDFILTVNNGGRHKNNRNLIRAHQRLRQKHPDLCLAIVGRVDRGLAGLAQSPGVIIVGIVSNAELAWAYNQSLAVVVASYAEGFGLIGLEAWVHGKPLISSRATCLPEVYADGAAYFDPAAPESIAAAIDSVLGDRVGRKALVAAGVGRLERFSWPRTAEKTKAVYDQALGRLTESTPTINMRIKIQSATQHKRYR